MYCSNKELVNKFMELIQEIKEDKKLTAFLEKRFREYERGITCSESTQYYKEAIEVSIFK